MYILSKQVPACLSVCAVAGITTPTILATTLKLIANVPSFIKAYEDVKNTISSYHQK